jgi:hypothetical protein
MKLIVYDSWAQSWARLLFLESRILQYAWVTWVHIVVAVVAARKATAWTGASHDWLPVKRRRQLFRSTVWHPARLTRQLVECDVNVLYSLVWWSKLWLDASALSQLQRLQVILTVFHPKVKWSLMTSARSLLYLPDLVRFQGRSQAGRPRLNCSGLCSNIVDRDWWRCSFLLQLRIDW